MPIDNEHNPVLGIDLGTTFSAIARWDGRGASVYQVGNHYDLQSVVYYDPNKDEDIFFPLFTSLEFIFYIGESQSLSLFHSVINLQFLFCSGWLKVGEELR